VSFFDGAESVSGTVPGSTDIKGSANKGGPVDFYKGAESVSGADVPSEDPQSIGPVPKSGNPVQSKVE